MPRRPRRPAQCTYCSAQGTTVDHVPPRQFIPVNRRRALITVPACAKCNNESGKDEEYMFAVLMFSDAGVSDAGRTLWDERMRGLLAKNRGLAARLARSFQPVELVTPRGLHLGRRTAITFEIPRLIRVVNKIVRGLYLAEFDERLPHDHPVNSVFIQSQSQFDDVAPLRSSLRPGRRQCPGVFEYVCGRAAEKPEGSLWIVRFFGTAWFWSVSGVDESRDKG